MQRALELAELGQGQVSPNPMVGCVIVYEGKVIGEGWHKKYGDWHAEVNAIAAVADQSLLSQSTAYVTLEPCAHFGKTPPCADLLIKHGLKRVVICNVDTNPLVGGKGIEKLQAAGIDVQTGVLESEGRQLNRRFFTFIEKKRPYVLLKWAQTADGFIARENYDSKWISNIHSRQLVHKWRVEEDAILVGTNTALYDNPRLNVREWSGWDPVRIVIDASLRLPFSLHLFDQSQPTLCYNFLKNESQEFVQYVKVNDPAKMIEEIGEDLYRRKIQSVMVEGGARLLQGFIEKEYWDEIRLFTASHVFGKGIESPSFKGKLVETQQLQGDRVDIYYPI